MAEPLKTFFRREVVENMARHLGRVDPEFDREGFAAAALNGLDALELKERANHIKDALAGHLPPEFSRAVTGLTRSLARESVYLEPSSGDNSLRDDGLAGWAVMPMTLYVAEHGMNDVGLSLTALYDMTKRFTSEFAIRYFLRDHPEQTLAVMDKWIGDPNHHARRLVSEGTRPRLPWAMRLDRFIADPAPVIALLERLKDDPSDYVRRSVANNLNDISKDHPDLVARIAADWLTGASDERRKLVRHGCRSLIKAGHRDCLAAFGYGEPEIRVDRFDAAPAEIRLGESVAIQATLASSSTRAQDLVIDYAVHHRKANGTASPKVFKWKTLKLEPGQTVSLEKRHPVKAITTRRYYDGDHEVRLLINGADVAGTRFALKT